MKCIKCKRDKDTGRVCIHGYHQIVEETADYTRYERLEKLEPLFVCQDCIRKALSGFRVLFCIALPFYMLMLLGSVYGMFTQSDETAGIIVFGFFALFGLIGVLLAISIIINPQAKKYVHMMCNNIINRYKEKLAFKQNFSGKATTDHLFSNNMLWFEATDSGVRYLGHAIKKGKKLVPSTDSPEFQQVKEAVVAELLNENDTDDGQ